MTPEKTLPETNSQAAIVWVHGMLCPQEAQRKVAAAVQAKAATNGVSLQIGIPEFLFNVPEPIDISSKISETLAQLNSSGFSGDQIQLAGHSLGAVFAQQYLKANKNSFKGLILMGSVLLQSQNTISASGSSVIDFDVPTLTLNGELDGLLRITRSAISYWHQGYNLDASQKGKFQTIALAGFNHSNFMDASMAPSTVDAADLKSEVPEEQAQDILSDLIVKFINSNSQISVEQQTSFSETLQKPLVEAINLEGNYSTKPPCQDTPTVNDTLPTCLKGSPWIETAQASMGGDLSKFNAKMTSSDNFHRVYTFVPQHHLPDITNKCPGTPAEEVCVLTGITVTENYYSPLDVLDTGFQPIAAEEQKAKMESRQKVHFAAGDPNPDFNALDVETNNCQDINQLALDWAGKALNSKQAGRQSQFGKQLVVGTDLGPQNVGPIWIWTQMQFTDNADKTQTVMQSPMMHVPDQYIIKAAEGFHYCKVLSPFRAMEWMLQDGLKDRYSKKSN